MEFLQLEYLKYHLGDRNSLCLVDALHAKPPQSDLFTGKIVEQLIAKENCAGIISNISRTVADLNRKPDGNNDLAIGQYRETIKKILEHATILDETKFEITKPFLHLSIHGMKNEHYGRYGVEVGTFQGQSCSEEMKQWFKEVLHDKARTLLPRAQIIFDNYFDGDESITYHRKGDGHSYPGYGSHFHTFQIEFSKTLRKHYQTEIVELLSFIMKNRNHS